MAKRVASSELNYDNWDAKDEKEDPGTFVVASDETLQNRVIIKAKRKLEKKDAAQISPFAAFSGFSSTASPKSFSFLKKSVSGTEGNSPLATETKNVEKNKNVNSDTNQLNEMGDKNADTKKSSSTSNVLSKDKATRSIEYYRQLQSLNESVLKWMQLHLSRNSCSDFTPVFNDYKKHLDTLNVTYPVKNRENSTSTEDKVDVIFKKPASPSKKHGMSSQNAKNDVNATGHSSSKMGNNLKHEDETDYGAHFSSNTTNTSTFSFGIKASPTSSSSSSSGPIRPTTSFEEEAADGKKDSFKFTFGVKNTQSADQSSISKSFSFPVAPGGKNTDTVSEESEYTPPKNEFTVVAEEDAVYSKRCKLFFKKGGEFTEKGVGILYLKPVGDKTQLLIRADTNLGNILLNILLTASIPVSRTGKNNVLLVCIPNPPLDVKNPDSKEAISVLIRVKTSEDADELLENLNKQKS